MLDKIFSKDNVYIIDQEFSDKYLFLDEIAEIAFSKKIVTSKSECLEGLKDRELQYTTGFQDGFAIPHCKSKAVLKPQLLVFKTKGIPWNSLDGKDINISFALLIPEESSKEHLKYLAKIAKGLIDDEFRLALKKAVTEEEIFNIIQKKLGE